MFEGELEGVRVCRGCLERNWDVGWGLLSHWEKTVKDLEGCQGRDMGWERGDWAKGTTG